MPEDQGVTGPSRNPWKPMFAAAVLSAIVVVLSCSDVSARGASMSNGKAGPSAAMPGKGSTGRHDRLASVRGLGGFHGFGSPWFDDQSFLIVDATPVEAAVFLDGRLLGSAGDLLARALPLGPGRHTAQVIATGFTPYVARFAADPGFSTRLRVALSHE